MTAKHKIAKATSNAKPARRSGRGMLTIFDIVDRGGFKLGATANALRRLRRRRVLRHKPHAQWLFEPKKAREVIKLVREELTA